MSEDVFPGSLTRPAIEPDSLPYARTMTVRAAAGAVLGLGWGAALRGWMVVLALQFGERPHFTWQSTFGGILLPAAIMGAMLGVASGAEGPSSRKWSRWAMLSPLLLVLGPALATDNFIPTLVTTGLGGGAIGVALIGLTGGFALSGTGPQLLRRVAGVFALLLAAGSAVGFGFAGGGSSDTPAKVFGGLLFALLMVLLVVGIGASTRDRSTRLATSDAP
jgi:hypothetical protein